MMKDGERVRRAKQARDRWDRFTKCPICKNPFQDGEACPHGIMQVQDHFENKIRMAYAAQDSWALKDRVDRLEAQVRSMTVEIEALKDRS